jgi:quinol monooxygenase YgiN
MSQFVLFITVTLEPGTKEAFMPIIQENAEASVHDEVGCHQFDVLISGDGTADTIYLYEVYDDEAAFAVHQSTAHYKKFKEASGAMVAQMDVIRLDAIRLAGD